MRLLSFAWLDAVALTLWPVAKLTLHHVFANFGSVIFTLDLSGPQWAFLFLGSMSAKTKVSFGSFNFKKIDLNLEGKREKRPTKQQSFGMSLPIVYQVCSPSITYKFILKEEEKGQMAFFMVHYATNTHLLVYLLIRKKNNWSQLPNNGRCMWENNTLW